MNPILHQWKWDFRHVRILWLCWLGLLALGVGGAYVSRFPDMSGRAFGNLFVVVDNVAIYLLGILLTARVVFATPFSGTSAFWKTRPLRRRDLFLCKTGLILVIIWLPVQVALAVKMSFSSPGASFLAWALGYYGLLTFSMYFLAAVWAAVCERFASFAVCVASSGAWAAVCALVIGRLTRNSTSFPIRLAGPQDHTAVEVSTTFSIAIVLAATALVAWILAGAAAQRRKALFVLAAGLALGASGQFLWAVRFFDRDGYRQNAIETTVRVLAKDEEIPAGRQLLWQQVAVEVPPRHFVYPTAAVLSFADDDGVHSTEQSVATPRPQRENELEQQALEDWYPAGTGLEHGGWHAESNLHERYRGMTGTFSGSLDLTFFEWQRIGSLPLREGAQTKLASGGQLRIAADPDAPGDATSVVLLGRSPGSQFRGFERYRDPVFVLHDPSAKRIEIARSGSRSMQWSGVFSLQTFRYDASFPRTATRYRAAAKPAENLRLDIFEAVPVGVAETVAFREDNWTAYTGRYLAPESVEDQAVRQVAAAAQLPANPTVEQVDAYLDAFLFSLPDHFRSSDDWNQAEAGLRRIGPEHLDRLLQRLPVGRYANDIVHRTIRKMVTEDHLPALLEAFEHDPQLASIFLEKNWQSEGAPVAAALLRKRVPLGWSETQQCVVMVAARKDPATYDDLRWHFEHVPTDHRSMIKALAQCPGFPLEDAIREAWKRNRFSHDLAQRGRLAGYAARFGDKEALRAAFVHYANSKHDDDLALLAEAVEHPGGDLLPAWLHQNFTLLVFNPDERRWRLPR